MDVIPCRQYFGTNVIDSSYIAVEEIPAILQGLRLAAQEWKKLFESEYVLYAAKIYNEDDFCASFAYIARLLQNLNQTDW